MAALTGYGTGAGNHDQTVTEASALYAHVIAVDTNGNATTYRSGPYFFDGAQTPDLIADLGQTNWTASGGKQVGQMVTARGVQKLFAGWNSDSLRLRWQGLNLASDGDLYLYLGTGSGGTITLFDPNGAGNAATLPFSANYLIPASRLHLRRRSTAQRGTWSSQGAVTAGHQWGDRRAAALCRPWHTQPGGDYLALAWGGGRNGMLDVWATVPDQNLGRVWTQYIEFASLRRGHYTG